MVRIDGCKKFWGCLLATNYITLFTLVSMGYHPSILRFRPLRFGGRLTRQPLVVPLQAWSPVVPLGFPVSLTPTGPEFNIYVAE